MPSSTTWVRDREAVAGGCDSASGSWSGRPKPQEHRGSRRKSAIRPWALSSLILAISAPARRASWAAGIINSGFVRTPLTARHTFRMPFSSTPTTRRSGSCGDSRGIGDVGGDDEHRRTTAGMAGGKRIEQVGPTHRDRDPRAAVDQLRDQRGADAAAGAGQPDAGTAQYGSGFRVHRSGFARGSRFRVPVQGWFEVRGSTVRAVPNQNQPKRGTLNQEPQANGPRTLNPQNLYPSRTSATSGR